MAAVGATFKVFIYDAVLAENRTRELLNAERIIITIPGFIELMKPNDNKEKHDTSGHTN